VDARVLDAGGREKKPQDASYVDFSRRDSCGLRKSSRAQPWPEPPADLSATRELRFLLTAL